jgi:hypothetical protein
VRSRPSSTSTSTPALPGFRVLGPSKSNDSDAKGPASINGSFPPRLRIGALLDQRAFPWIQHPCEPFERVQMVPIASSTVPKPRARTRHLNAFKRSQSVAVSKQVNWTGSRTHYVLAGRNRVSPRDSSEVFRYPLYPGSACSFRENAPRFIPFERVQMSLFRAGPGALGEPVQAGGAMKQA